MSHLFHSITRHDGTTDDAWHAFTCGHCGNKVSGGILSESTSTRWLLCPICQLGSVCVNGSYYPGSAFGPALEGLPAEVETAYNEARRCMSVNAPTASELICRKILMHVAADKGAKEGKSFESYLGHLETLGYITPAMKPWVDLIRQHGNAATHRLETPDRERAESTTMLTAELLRIIYEMQHLADKYAPKSATKAGDV